MIRVAGSLYLSRSLRISSENHGKEFDIVCRVLPGQFFFWDIVKNANLENFMQNNFNMEKKIWWLYKKLTKLIHTSYHFSRLLYITRSLESYIGFLFSNLCHSVFYLTAKFQTVQWVYERFFHSRVFWVKHHFSQCPFLYIFRSFVLSAICSFDQMSFGHMSIGSLVFRSYVRSAICLSAICPTTARTIAAFLLLGRFTPLPTTWKPWASLKLSHA